MEEAAGQTACHVSKLPTELLERVAGFVAPSIQEFESVSNRQGSSLIMPLRHLAGCMRKLPP